MLRTILDIIDQARSQNIAGHIALALSSKHEYQEYYPDKIYDLASLTKIIGTGLAVAQAIVNKRISLDECPFASWPTVSVKHLLAHTSGLSAHVKFYAEPDISKNCFLKNSSLIFKELFKQIPKNSQVRLYSDLNFLALGWLLEHRLNKPLIEIFRDTWKNYNLPQFAYFPSGQSPRLNLDNIAPTGFCPVRNMRVHAQVHDLNCYFLGGLSGHAGLFGTLDELSAVGNFFLRSIKEKANALEELLAYFAHAGLAFAKPEARGSVRGLSPSSFGHFGFTGVSLWMDPKLENNEGLTIALLSNRVDKSLSPEGIFWLRERIHSLVARSRI